MVSAGLVYWVDIGMRFRMGFCVVYNLKRELIMDGGLIAHFYVRHDTFLLDFLAALPSIAEVKLLVFDDVISGLGKCPIAHVYYTFLLDFLAALPSIAEVQLLFFDSVVSRLGKCPIAQVLHTLLLKLQLGLPLQRYSFSSLGNVVIRTGQMPHCTCLPHPPAGIVVFPFVADEQLLFVG